MLDNSFLVPSLCKLNHINLCFIQISTKSPAELLFPFRESTVFFEVIPGVLGRLLNFNITKIFIKTAHVSRLSVSCDYDIIRISYYKADDSFVSNWSILPVEIRLFHQGKMQLQKIFKKRVGIYYSIYYCNINIFWYGEKLGKIEDLNHLPTMFFFFTKWSTQWTKI